MVRSTSLGLLAAVSLSVSIFGAGCGASSDSGASSDDSAATAATAALGSDFSGTIGGKAVHIRLATQGSAVTGSYFYDTVAANGSLVLKGTRTGNKITLTESVNGAGAATGTWNGTIGADGISGTWKSPTGSSLALAMTEIKPGTNAVVTRKTKQDVKFTGEGGLGDCSLDATVVEVFGLSSATAEAAINKALTPEPLDLDAQGKCSEFDDIRTINHTVTLNASGFLTVSVNEEDDGGAHPEIAINYFNFRLSDGAQLTAKDFFADGAATTLRQMVVDHINAETDLDADDKKDTLDTFDQEWASDGSMSLDGIQFGVSATGITLDMTNNYPHVVLAEAPSIDFTWADLKPVLKADSPLAALVK